MLEGQPRRRKLVKARALRRLLHLPRARSRLSRRPGPDLRESRIALDPESFRRVVHDGDWAERTMPGFETLSRQQMMQIYAYVGASARKARGPTTDQHE